MKNPFRFIQKLSVSSVRKTQPYQRIILVFYVPGLLGPGE